MTRTNPYPMNNPEDYSMLTQPKLRLNDTVIVWDEDEGGEWAQARVVDATFNRKMKCWEYSAVVEFVDEYKAKTGDIMFYDMRIKDWYYFSDEELDTTAFSTVSGVHYIVIKK